MSSSARTTRRDFLKTAAALAVPCIVPARALGRARRPAPSERITLGLIGLGNMGSGHLETLLGFPEVQVLAVCDVDARKRQRACQRVEEHYAAQSTEGTYRGCDQYNEFEELLARPDIDAVVIAVPDHWHAIIAIAACRAGKDVYCEKPLSLTIREAQEMVAAARRYGTVFQTGSQQRSSREFRYACELIRNGRIGKLERIHVGIGLPSEDKELPEEPVPPGFDWDRWLGPAPWKPYNAERCSGDYSGGWRLIRDYSGGMTTDWGAHHFDIVQWALGMDGSGPVEIIPPGCRGYDTLTFIYENGIPMYRGGANGIRFVGSEGQIEVNRGYLKSTPAHITKDPIGPGEIHLYESPGHHQDWLNCICTRARPICDVAVGASTAIVCHLGNIASWLGRPIRWDPVSQQIVGDEAASRWLDRPRRAPWRLHLW
jgi:predicted dehydrogenase